MTWEAALAFLSLMHVQPTYSCYRWYVDKTTVQNAISVRKTREDKGRSQWQCYVAMLTEWASLLLWYAIILCVGGLDTALPGQKPFFSAMVVSPFMREHFWSIPFVSLTVSIDYTFGLQQHDIQLGCIMGTMWGLARSVPLAYHVFAYTGAASAPVAGTVVDENEISAPQRCMEQFIEAAFAPAVGPNPMSKPDIPLNYLTDRSLCQINAIVGCIKRWLLTFMEITWQAFLSGIVWDGVDEINMAPDITRQAYEDVTDLLDHRRVSGAGGAILPDAFRVGTDDCPPGLLAAASVLFRPECVQAWRFTVHIASGAPLLQLLLRAVIDDAGSLRDAAAAPQKAYKPATFLSIARFFVNRYSAVTSSTTSNPLLSLVRDHASRRVLLCAFHVLKNFNERIRLGEIPRAVIPVDFHPELEQQARKDALWVLFIDHAKSMMYAETRELFQHRWQELQLHWEPIMPGAIAYLKSTWVNDEWLPLWAMYARAQYHADTDTSDANEAHFHVIKSFYAHMKVCKDPRRPLWRLVGKVNPGGGGDLRDSYACLVQQIFDSVYRDKMHDSAVHRVTHARRLKLVEEGVALTNKLRASVVESNGYSVRLLSPLWRRYVLHTMPSATTSVIFSVDLGVRSCTCGAGHQYCIHILVVENLSDLVPALAVSVAAEPMWHWNHLLGPWLVKRASMPLVEYSRLPVLTLPRAAVANQSVRPATLMSRLVVGAGTIPAVCEMAPLVRGPGATSLVAIEAVVALLKAGMPLSAELMAEAGREMDAGRMGTAQSAAEPLTRPKNTGKLTALSLVTAVLQPRIQDAAHSSSFSLAVCGYHS